MIQSPLNYTGGKYKLLSQILPLFPTDIDTFVDLFCGGCNVGINVAASRHIYNDTNQYLLYLYNTLKNNDKDIVIEIIYGIIEKYGLSLVSEYGYDYYGCDSSAGLGSYNKEKFLKMRDDFNFHTNKDYYYYILLYVIIVYSFNNQIRFNKNGEFNLPVGKRDFNSKMQQKLIDFIDVIKKQNSHFTCIDFCEFDISSLTEQDFVYMDPPYLITCATYNEQDGWNVDKEKQLLEFIERLTDKGIRCALSNVLRSKGKENNVLLDWLDRNNGRYTIHHLTCSYANSNYHTKDKSDSSEEVLITNY
ncbi:MAG: DNA adenine methylase [Clostridia bacterium]|nr:DNA adenine methylase [Clostridia bacterium]